ADRMRHQDSVRKTFPSQAQFAKPRVLTIIAGSSRPRNWHRADGANSIVLPRIDGIDQLSWRIDIGLDRHRCRAEPGIWNGGEFVTSNAIRWNVVPTTPSVVRGRVKRLTEFDNGEINARFRGQQRFLPG